MKMNKEIAIFDGIIRNYRSHLAKAIDNGEARYEDYKIESILEGCAADESGREWVNKDGEKKLVYDLVEGFIDVKSSSVKLNNQDTVFGVITNTGSKIGYLWVVLYNDYTGQLDYFLIPHEKIAKLQARDTTNSKYNINVTYSPSKKSYNRLEEYRVETFKDLCSG